jgi:ribonuclease PH
MTQTDRNYRITLIEDLNKIKMFMEDKPITVEQFDELYDMDIRDVEAILSMNSMIMRYHIPV